MRDIEQIWDDVPVDITSVINSGPPSKQSATDYVKYFKKIMWIEFFGNVGVLLLFIVFWNDVPGLFKKTIAICFLVGFGVFIYAFVNLRKIEIISDVLLFNQRCYDFLNSYIWAFALSVQVALSVVLAIMFFQSNDIDFFSWLTGSLGRWALGCVLFVEVFLMGYVYLVYWPIRNGIKEVLHDLSE